MRGIKTGPVSNSVLDPTIKDQYFLARWGKEKYAAAKAHLEEVVSPSSTLKCSLTAGEV
jgi:hypothetical protein